jgi:hypothetical protein
MSSVPPGELRPETIRSELARLLNREVTSVERIGGGHNSQVYKIATDGAERFALKIYFRHATDHRDRLAGEFGSFSYLWQNGFREIPQPVISDAALGWAIYQFIEGEKIPRGQVRDADVAVAADFLGRLRELSRRPESRKLGSAAEAFFALNQIVDNVRQRLSRLEDLGSTGGSPVPPGDSPDGTAGAPRDYREALSPAELSPIPPGESPSGAGGAPALPTDAQEQTAPYGALCVFLEKEFKPLLERVVRWSEERLKAAGMSFTEELSLHQRTLSPSDFGFHNALRQPDGRMIFLDFEYFGWDDPAKMIADFLLHPAMDLSPELKKKFASTLVRRFADWPKLSGRVESVYPLFGLKWCMIMLNEFLPEQLLRRQFAATAAAGRIALQMQQLDKARQMADRIRGEYERFPYHD